MKEKIRALIVADDADACRLLMLALVNFLRTSKSGVLSDSEVRKVLADRLENALTVKAADVSDALGITLNRSASSPYGNCKYEFILWYWGYMAKETKPSNAEKQKWLEDYGNSPSSGSTVNAWIAEAKKTYSDALMGAAAISAFSNS